MRRRTLGLAALLAMLLAAYALLQPSAPAPAERLKDAPAPTAPEESDAYVARELPNRDWEWVGKEIEELSAGAQPCRWQKGASRWARLACTLKP